MSSAISMQSLLAGVDMAFTLTTASPAQTSRTETVSAAAASAGTIIQGTIKGEESVDQLVSSEQSAQAAARTFG